MQAFYRIAIILACAFVAQSAVITETKEAVTPADDVLTRLKNPTVVPGKERRADEEDGNGQRHVCVGGEGGEGGLLSYRLLLSDGLPPRKASRLHHMALFTQCMPNEKTISPNISGRTKVVALVPGSNDLFSPSSAPLPILSRFWKIAGSSVATAVPLQIDLAGVLDEGDAIDVSGGRFYIIMLGRLPY
ncbi:hypothetical protein GALMADRAFT_215041 [Galerina marginata CBS 339.88]|uniref:Uncharacterized protein n=1 Tax=Galerina marginata (strain CBS 339.88) TaxID=685588 RepID=A0A067SI32_GALM3|nr:hypothetical protein GALMADRAFT_215041 [Galerina marginata CBS 339.88]